MHKRLLAGAILPLAACAPVTGTRIDADAVVRAPAAWPTPLVAADQTPRILTVWMNETAIAPGSTWSGRIVTSTNVASVEVRTESFSFIADRTAYGEFSFEQNVLDMVAQYKRPYTLHIIARNAAGDRDERIVAIAFK
jgi:hypothetical protein